MHLAMEDGFGEVMFGSGDKGKHRTVVVTKILPTNLTRETARAMQAEKASAAQVESINDTNAFIASAYI